MARTPKSLDIQRITDASLITLAYVVPANTVTTAKLVITNASLNVIDISVYINDGVSDFILAQNKIPAGVGKSWRVLELYDEKLAEGFSVKVQATTTDAYNVFLSGSEIIDDELV